MKSITYKDQLILTGYLKFDKKALEKMKSLIKKSKSKKSLLKKINKTKKKLIPQNIIQTFYN